MTMQELLDDQRAEGKTEGKAEERTRLLTLIPKLIRDGLSDEIGRLDTDEEFYKSMLERYHLI